MINNYLKHVLAVMLTAIMLISQATVYAAPAADIPQDMQDNVFIDALAYIGYNVQAQKNDGSLYIKWGESATAYGSGIPYGASPVEGTNTTAAGTPDIALFKSRGLQCGGFATYVYFNYLPNVKGGSFKTAADNLNAAYAFPAGTHNSAAYWKEACSVWAAAGLAEDCMSSPWSDVPVGAVLLFTGTNGSYWSGHVAIYAGAYNGSHYVIHTGNSRGPEINTVENLELTGDGKANLVLKDVYAFLEYPENDRKGSIEVYKKDTQGTPLSGAVFTTVHTQTNASYTIGPTNADGYAVIRDIPLGTYTVTETTFPEGYEASGESTWNVTVDGSAAVTVNAVNRLIPGTGQIVKTAEDGNVEGVSFRVTGAGYDKTAVTDAAGTINTQLAPGIYTVTELTDNRYEPQSSQTLTVTARQTSTVHFYNRLKKGSVKVTKTAEDAKVEGITFKLSGTSASGAAVEMTAVTNADGVAVFNDVLISGSEPYRLEELGTAGYYVPVNAQEISVNWNTQTQAAFNNALKYGSVKVTKTAEDGKVEGVTFKLSGTSASGAAVEMTAVTNADGVAVFNGVLISGSEPYRLEELGTAGYYVPVNAQEISVNWNREAQATFNNALKHGSVKVTKTSEDGRIEGITFKLTGTSASGAAVELTATTGADGTAVFNDVLISGDKPYRLEEVGAAGYYVPVNAQDISVNWNTQAQAAFNNALKHGSVKVIKTSEDGRIEGITFKLTGTSASGAAVELTATTGADGIAVFNDVLISGDKPYRLEEVGAAGYYVPVNAQDISVSWNRETAAAFNNVLKKGSVKVTKTSEDGKIEGITFKLSGTSASGAAVEMTAITGEDGTALFENVPITGTVPYKIEETDIPDYYVPQQPQYVFVNEDSGENAVATAAFENILRKGKLLIRKTSSNGKVEGFGFLIKGTSVSGTAVELTAVTDANGLINIPDMLIGEYVVSELEDAASAPYKRPLPQTVRVSDEGALILEMHNELIDTPQTGDTTNLIPLLISAICAALTFISCMLFKKGRKTQ